MLTNQQKRFCEEYVKDLNGTRAYLAAYPGCKKKDSARANASKLLAKTNVSAYVRELNERISEKLQITAEDVVRDLIKVKDRCMQAEPVKVWDPDSHSLVDSDAEYTFDSKGANQALKLLGDHLGMFRQKVEVSGDVEQMKKLDNILEKIEDAAVTETS